MNPDELTDEQLIGYVFEALPASLADHVRRRIEADPHALERVARLRKIRAIARSDDSLAPPADVLSRAQSLFAERSSAAAASAGADILSQVRRFLAALAFDSRRSEALRGFRGGADGYQLSYESAAAEVDLEVAPDSGGLGDNRRLLGQITPAEPMVARSVSVRPAGCEDVVQTVSPDAHGVFSLTLATGRYDFCIVLDLGEMLIEGCEIE